MPKVGKKDRSMPKELQEKIKCADCKKELVSSNFYNTNNILSNGKSSICKTCTKKRIDYKNINTIYDVLKGLDIPFLYNYWQICKEKTPNEPFGNYIRMANSKINEFKTATWKDSIFEPTCENENRNAENDYQTEEISSSQLSKLREKYGYGFKNEEYLNFERKYKKLSRGYKEKTELHSERLITYIIHKVKEEMATASGEVAEAEKWAKLAQADATAAKLNVSQLSKSDITGGIDLVPQLAEAVEQYVSLIPLLPKVLAQPYDDADLIMWSNINYLRRLEEKPIVAYRDIWCFYDEMLEEYYKQKGFNEEQITDEKQKRNNVFRDLSDVYKEPLYENPDDFTEDEGEIDGIV